MYNLLTHEIEINTQHMIADFDLMVAPLPALNGSFKRVSFKTMAQLKHMTSEQLNSLYSKIFGETVFNPYADRYMMIIFINRVMTQQVELAIAALSGREINVDGELMAMELDGRRNWDFVAMRQQIDENEQTEAAVEITPVKVQTELDLFFSAETVFQMTGVNIQYEGLDIIVKLPSTRRAPLTVEQVKDVKRMFANGVHFKEVATVTGISIKTLERIWSGNRYAEIEI